MEQGVVRREASRSIIIGIPKHLALALHVFDARLHVQASSRSCDRHSEALGHMKVVNAKVLDDGVAVDLDRDVSLVVIQVKLNLSFVLTISEWTVEHVDDFMSTPFSLSEHEL